MPNRRRKRASHQVVVVPQHLDIWVAGLSSVNFESSMPRQSLSMRSRANSFSMPSPPASPPLSLKNGDENRKCIAFLDTSENEVLNQVSKHISNPTVSGSGLIRIGETSPALQRSNAVKVSMMIQQAAESNGLKGSNKSSIDYTRPSRSFTSASLTSNVSINSNTSSGNSIFSTAMPLADSSMSIQSQQSESSLLSAVISASGFPSMNMMMDQVDRSIAADSHVQLVENAHVGLACVTVVDRNMIAEPCSAEIETWVS
ncbi:hypothetical protein FBU30_003923 [Linnemannia zychae]|nr:hypothetical protein FBU30_003923 [Linnemannia zychae]